MKAKLVIVTDRGVMKAYKFDSTPRGTPHFDLLEEVVLEEAHHRLVEEVTDLAGRRAAPVQRSWGTPLADAHNRKLETQRRLLKEIAGHIQRLSQRHPEVGMWVAAPKEMNHPMLEVLSRTVRARIQVNLPRDLVKADKEELAEHFVPEKQSHSTAGRATTPIGYAG